jgi:hypothetical protein
VIMNAKLRFRCDCIWPRSNSWRNSDTALHYDQTRSAQISPETCAILLATSR